MTACNPFSTVRSASYVYDVDIYKSDVSIIFMNLDCDIYYVCS